MRFWRYGKASSRQSWHLLLVSCKYTLGRRRKGDPFGSIAWPNIMVLFHFVPSIPATPPPDYITGGPLLWGRVKLSMLRTNSSVTV
jgi:hypothetical protein